MTTEQQIQNYISTQPEPKSNELQTLHNLILKTMLACRLWFLDGKDENGKIVSNPNIGYGTHTMKYANGSTKEFYKVGLSANTTGISVYIMGIDNKKFLSETYGKRLGKASVTGYCIKFKTLKDVNIDVFEEIIKYINDNE
jgi:hypothetical protein